MRPFLERLEAGDTLVCDGAMGTMLLQRDLKQGECPEAVNLTRPEVLEEIARSYFDAGADIIETNTFGASPLKLAQYGLDAKVDEINRGAVHAIRRVVEDRAYVAASCGPTGRLLKPYGDTEPEDVYNSFARQIECLIGAGVDVICVETMIDLAEASLLIKAAKDVSPATPVTATMTFDPTPRGFYTIMGVNIEKAASGLREAGADVVGSNCGNGIENMVKIAAEFRRCSDLPIIIQSNAGLPQTKGGVTVYPETPDFMADKARALVAAGVSIIGGCCGTTPDHIRAIRKMVDSSTSRRGTS
ncbi:MAG: homocysteine S-methyltransferase family protein [Phycisphaerae bacterium]|nr:homocysteine S-methyltransferase family protein [Phycisphaerae bacterium]